MRSIDGFVWVLSFRFPALGTEYMFFCPPLIAFGQMYLVKLPQVWFYDGKGKNICLFIKFTSQIFRICCR